MYMFGSWNINIESGRFLTSLSFLIRKVGCGGFTNRVQSENKPSPSYNP